MGVVERTLTFEVSAIHSFKGVEGELQPNKTIQIKRNLFMEGSVAYFQFSLCITIQKNLLNQKLAKIFAVL